MSERVVLKYPLEAGETTIVVGAQMRVVHVGVNPSGSQTLPCVWVEQDEHAEIEEVFMLRFHGTGHPIPERSGEHVGSAVCGPYVWHVYLERRAP